MKKNLLIYSKSLQDKKENITPLFLMLIVLIFFPLSFFAALPSQYGINIEETSNIIFGFGNAQIVGTEYFPKNQFFSAAQCCAVAEFNAKSNFYLI